MSHKSIPHPTAYRRDIDGLRAIAVLAVILFHAFPQYLSGGFIGVDIFFVISGYLITKIIFQEMHFEQFSLSKFYSRRIKRIFPALITMTFLVFIVGWYFLPPQKLGSLGMHIAGSTLFLQNIVLLNQVGYFDIEAETKPLLHLWSLGIEEQFYIFWPLFLLFMKKYTPKWILPMTAGLMLASFVLCLCLVHQHHAEQAFYLPFTRSWELLLGSLLAIKRFSITESISRDKNIRHEVIALLALLLLAYGLSHFHAKSQYPGIKALVPVIAALLLLISHRAWFNRTILSNKFMVAMGLISYPLYLWHYPLMAYARIMLPDGIPALINIGLIFFSVLLATLTYFLIERPIRFSQKKTYQIPGLLSVMCIMGAFGFYVERTNGIEASIPDQLRPYMLTRDETFTHWRRTTCLLMPDQAAAAFSPECSGDKKQPLLLIWGDSYAAAFYAGLNNVNNKARYGLAQYTAAACPPLLGFSSPTKPYCAEINTFVMKKIQTLKPDTVILHSTWDYQKDELDTGLSATVAALKALHVPKIILLGPVPSWQGNGLVENVFYYYQNSLHQLIPIHSKYRSNFEADHKQEAALQQLAQTLNISYVSPLKVMCNTEGCLTRIGKESKELTAFDYGHLTLAGATYLSHAILPELLP